MKPRTRLKNLSIIIVVATLHVFLSVYLYTDRLLLSIIAIVMILFISVILLRYFSRTIQYMLAHRIAKYEKPDHYFVFNIILGVVVNAILIYSLFIMLFAHIQVVIKHL